MCIYVRLCVHVCAMCAAVLYIYAPSAHPTISLYTAGAAVEGCVSVHHLPHQAGHAQLLDEDTGRFHPQGT